MRAAVLLMLLLTAAACSDRAKPPPIPSGATFRINPERWPAATVATARP